LALNLLGIRIVLTTLGVGAAARVRRAGRLRRGALVLAGLGLLLLVVQQTWATVLQAELRQGWVTTDTLSTAPTWPSTPRSPSSCARW